MNIQIFAKNKCFDSKKAQRWFKERGIKFQLVDLSSKGMSKGEIDSVIRAVGSLDAIIDCNAKSNEATLLKYLGSEQAKIEKLLDNPSLIKSPIVRNGKQATVGYCPEVWGVWE
ncbi:MAG: arsenate reductase family protein [Oscillospiraceae bacterium]|nr:arsenate reductase family protein [Oscillospiraceae bacterium]